MLQQSEQLHLAQCPSDHACSVPLQFYLLDCNHLGLSVFTSLFTIQVFFFTELGGLLVLAGSGCDDNSVGALADGRYNFVEVVNLEVGSEDGVS